MGRQKAYKREEATKLIVKNIMVKVIGVAVGIGIVVTSKAKKVVYNAWAYNVAHVLIVKEVCAQAYEGLG